VDAISWGALTFGNGLYVAVAESGASSVMTSSDGITWTLRTVPEDNLWRSVTFGNGLFVAVAHSGTNRVMTSPDGITWTARAAAEANDFYSVSYGNGLFVAVSITGTNRTMTSPNGITWTAVAAAEATQWYAVTYGDNLFVAVAVSGTNQVMTTPVTSLVANVGIGTTSPNSSALLDVSSTNKGALLPRLNTTQQNAISSPATGLIIWNTDSLTLCQYTGVSWRRIGNAAWVDYSGTSTVVGWSSFTTKNIRYSVSGKQCTVNYYIEGTSDATSITFTLPFAIGASGVTPLQGITFAINSGSSAIAQFSLVGSTVTLNRFNAIGGTTGWTNSGTKRAAGTFVYEID